VGKKIVEIQQLHPRALNPKSTASLEVLAGARIADTHRRGKFLWLTLDRPFALVAHLGMSGQFLIDSTDQRHTRALITLRSGLKKSELHFNDQRTFGWLSVEEVKDGLPSSVQKIAPDPFSAEFNRDQVIAAIGRRSAAIKTIILNQNILSGIGNIYADESLWLAKIHPERPAHLLTKGEIGRVLDSAKEVMASALEVGGTSFDELYINVNGESGYFDISLNAYGQEGKPCPRCATPIKRIKFANRSSHFCPNCQKVQKAQKVQKSQKN
jgi:formamidopyrimidine-DNA glycosylase